MRRLGSGSHHGGDGASSTNNNNSSSNVRSLVASGFIPKGSVLATVPASTTLQGQTAHTIVQRVLGSDKYRRLLDFAASKDETKKKKKSTTTEEEESPSSSSSPSSYEARSANTFVALSSRNCIVMLCALASARVFIAQQRHLSAAIKKNGGGVKKNLPPPLEIFTALGVLAPPPAWLLHWCKFGLPTKHFAAGIAAAEAQQLRLEKVQRRKLNVIPDPEPQPVLLEDGSINYAESESNNMGFLPSHTAVPTNYLGPSVPTTLMDVGGVIRAGDVAVNLAIAERMPALESPSSLGDTGRFEDNNPINYKMVGSGGGSQQQENEAIAAITDGVGPSDAMTRVNTNSTNGYPLSVADEAAATGRPELLVALERIAKDNNGKAVIGGETRAMGEMADMLDTVRRLAAEAEATSSPSSSESSQSSPSSSLVPSSSSSALSNTAAYNGPISLEPFAPNRTRDLVEVVATPSMLATFLKDEPLVLSEEKQRMLVAHKYGERAALEETALRSAALDAQLLRPIAKILVGHHHQHQQKKNAASVKRKDTNTDVVVVFATETNNNISAVDDDAIDDDALDLGPIMDDLRWAHAMLRSRAINANWSLIGKKDAAESLKNSLLMQQQHELFSGEGKTSPLDLSAISATLVEPALIPIVDLLNHAAPEQANATFVPTVTNQHVEVPASSTAGGASSAFPTAAKSSPSSTTVVRPSRAYSIIASRDINEGEMLSLYYGHYRQRTIMFEEDPISAAEELAAVVAGGGSGTGVSGGAGGGSGNGSGSDLVDLSSVPNAARERLAVQIDMKRIEDQQRWGNKGPSGDHRSAAGIGSRVGFGTGVGGGTDFINDDALNDAKSLYRDPRAARRRLDESVTEAYFERNAIEVAGGDASSSSSSPSTQPARGTALKDTRKIATKKFSGLSDGDWSWNFGFTKSDEEKHNEIKKRFNKDLSKRIANMTNPMRKGRRGEFIVGVPPGISQLQEHRARLQHDQYGGHTVFPPQRV